MRTTVPLRNSGRVVIPQPMRQQLALEYGDLVELEIRPVEETREKVNETHH